MSGSNLVNLLKLFRPDYGFNVKVEQSALYERYVQPEGGDENAHIVGSLLLEKLYRLDFFLLGFFLAATSGSFR